MNIPVAENSKLSIEPPGEPRRRRSGVAGLDRLHRHLLRLPHGRHPHQRPRLHAAAGPLRAAAGEVGRGGGRQRLVGSSLSPPSWSAKADHPRVCLPQAGASAFLAQPAAPFSSCSGLSRASTSSSPTLRIIDKSREARQLLAWQTRGWSAFADHDGLESERGLLARHGQPWACPWHDENDGDRLTICIFILT